MNCRRILSVKISSFPCPCPFLMFFSTFLPSLSICLSHNFSSLSMHLSIMFLFFFKFLIYLCLLLKSPLYFSQSFFFPLLSLCIFSIALCFYFDIIFYLGCEEEKKETFNVLIKSNASILEHVCETLL